MNSTRVTTMVQTGESETHERRRSDGDFVFC